MLQLIERLPFVIAHRGGRYDGIEENTLEAFEKALQLGVHRLETDAHLTKSGEVVAVHGADIHGNIVDGDTSNIFVHIGGKAVLISSIKPSDRSAMATDGFYIPLVDEVYDLSDSVHLNIDAKHPEVVDALLKVVERHQAFGRTTLASFEKSSIERLRAGAPEGCSTALIQEELVNLVLSEPGQELKLPRNARAQIPTKFGELNLIEPWVVEVGHRNNIAVEYWTINDAPTMQQIIDLGADGIFTDEVSLLQSIIGQDF